MKKIEYLNTDLNIKSAKPFKKLNTFLTGKKLLSLHYGKVKGEWWGTYAICNPQYKTPKKTIEIFLKELSQMGETIRKQWDQCNLKEFDIGYECGQKPGAFNNEIPKDILGKLIELDIGIRITIYPEDKNT
ncbi:MAG: hypothetical protein ABH952_12060 [Candidatus Omnitrophota bacterium]